MPASNENGKFDMLDTIPAEIDSFDESDKMFNPDKSKVECICPMCGQKHIMNIYWIGRGSPRKYCQNCKGSL